MPTPGLLSRSLLVCAQPAFLHNSGPPGAGDGAGHADLGPSTAKKIVPLIKAILESGFPVFSPADCCQVDNKIYLDRSHICASY